MRIPHGSNSPVGKPSRRPFQLVLAIGLAVALAAACTTSLTESNDSGGVTYTVGVLAPETGTHAEDGPIVRTGVELALEDIRRSGVLGKDDLDIAYVDNQALASETVSAFNQMISLERPIASLTTFSGPTLAITPIAERNDVPLLNPGGVTPSLSGASPYLFNLVPLVDVQAAIMLHYVAEERLGKRIALLYSNDALGQGVEQRFADVVRRAGLDYAGSVAFDPASADHRAPLSKLQSLRPDAVYETASASQSGNLINQAADLGFTPRWLGYSAFGHQDTIDIGGKAAEGSLFTIPSTYDPETGKHYPEYNRYYDEFTRHTGESHSDYLTQTSYEAVQLIAAGIAKLKSRGKEVGGDTLRAELARIEGFRSLYGPGTVRADGSLVQSQAVQQVSDGQFVNRRIYSVDEIAGLE